MPLVRSRGATLPGHPGVRELCSLAKSLVVSLKENFEGGCVWKICEHFRTQSTRLPRTVDPGYAGRVKLAKLHQQAGFFELVQTNWTGTRAPVQRTQALEGLERRRRWWYRLQAPAIDGSSSRVCGSQASKLAATCPVDEVHSAQSANGSGISTVAAPVFACTRHAPGGSPAAGQSFV